MLCNYPPSVQCLRRVCLTSLTSSRRSGCWCVARRAAAGDLWCVMVTMLLWGPCWGRCLWDAGEEDGGRWGSRDKLRVRPDEPWDTQREVVKKPSHSQIHIIQSTEQCMQNYSFIYTPENTCHRRHNQKTLPSHDCYTH